MSLRTRRALPLLFAAALLLAAAPASADGGRKHHKHHHKHAKHHWKHHGGHRHHDGGGHGGYYAPSYVVRHSYGYPVYHHAPQSYYCGPCSHYFESYDHLSHHVHHHHHIAAIELPSVIFQASIGGGVGWVFGH